MAFPFMVLENEFGDKFKWFVLGGDLPGVEEIATGTILGNLSGDDAIAEAITVAQFMAVVTPAQVTGKALTGYVLGADTAVLASDTILQAIGKLQAQINSP